MLKGILQQHLQLAGMLKVMPLGFLAAIHMPKGGVLLLRVIMLTQKVITQQHQARVRMHKDTEPTQKACFLLQEVDTPKQKLRVLLHLVLILSLLSHTELS